MWLSRPPASGGRDLCKKNMALHPMPGAVIKSRFLPPDVQPYKMVKQPSGKGASYFVAIG